MSLLKLPPNYWAIAAKLKTILEGERDNIIATLVSEDVKLPFGSVDIHIGHWVTISHWPVIEIVGTDEDRPWLAQAYVRDLPFNFRIFCGVKNVDRADKDHDISTLAACVTAILDSRDWKNYTISVSGVTWQIYDSGIGSQSIVTLNSGTMIAAELSYNCRVWFQIPEDFKV